MGKVGAASFIICECESNISKLKDYLTEYVSLNTLMSLINLLLGIEALFLPLHH